MFRLVTACFPLVVLLLAEISFRIVPRLNEDRDPYVNISPISIFSRTMVDGKEYYNITHPSVINGADVHIPVKKPQNTIRVFCLGSSACASWPHPPTETFSAYLQQSLEFAYPDKQIEVVNAAAHGFAAYRTRRVLDEVLQMEPDAVIVWEGNNEFLEDRNYDSPNMPIAFLTRHLRTIQWLNAKFSSRNKMSGKELNDVAHFFWTKTRQQSLKLRADPVQFAQVEEHFHLSMEHMVTASYRHQVPIVLCTVPVNLRGWLPTVSHNRLRGEQLQQWQKLYYEARRCLINHQYEEGIQIMNKAIVLENEHAESYFWLGRLLEADGQKAAARDAYSKARDLDYNPFRALSGFNETIRTLAEQHEREGVHLLDLDNIFGHATQYAAPGFDMFLDYVHPTKIANLLVAESAFGLVISNSVLKEAPKKDQFAFHDLTYGTNGEPYRDETDFDLQSKELNVAIENRQYERVVHVTEILFQRRTGHRLTGSSDPILKSDSSETAMCYKAFWNYLEAERRLIMGEPASEAAFEEAKRGMQEYYDKWYPLGRF